MRATCTYRLGYLIGLWLLEHLLQALQAKR